MLWRLLAVLLLTTTCYADLNFEAGWEDQTNEWSFTALESAPKSDRIVIVTNHDADFDKKLTGLLPLLLEKKWTVSTEDHSQIQILDAERDRARITLILGKVPSELPVLVKLEDGLVVREIKPGCGLPVTGSSLYWLYTGEFAEAFPAKKETVKVKTSGGYPIRGHWWSVEGNWAASAPTIRTHLLRASKHRGKFDSGWLDTLTREELNSLHSDDHEGRVQWASVNKPGVKEEQPVLVVRPPRASTTIRQSCPTGNCPNQRQYRYFRQ